MASFQTGSSDGDFTEERIVSTKDWPRIDLEIRASLIQGMGPFDAAKKFSGTPSKVFPFTPFDSARKTVDFWIKAFADCVRRAVPGTSAGLIIEDNLRDVFFVADHWDFASGGLLGTPAATRAAILDIARQIQNLDRGLWGATGAVTVKGVTCLDAQGTGGFWDRSGKVAIAMMSLDVPPVTVGQFWEILVSDAPENIKALASESAKVAGKIARAAGEVAGEAIGGFGEGLGVPALLFIGGVAVVALH